MSAPLRPNIQAESEGLLRVAPSDTERSFLLKKIRLPLDPIYGDSMPRGGEGLPADKFEAIKQWISDGAPEN